VFRNAFESLRKCAPLPAQTVKCVDAVNRVFACLLPPHPSIDDGRLRLFGVVLRLPSRANGTGISKAQCVTGSLSARADRTPGRIRYSCRERTRPASGLDLQLFAHMVCESIRNDAPRPADTSKDVDGINASALPTCWHRATAVSVLADTLLIDCWTRTAAFDFA
jgi:hypothetical protein